MKCKDCTNYICHHRTTDAERDCFFEEQMVIETNKLVMEFIDWDKFRREAAKDILCAMINRENQFLMNGKTILNPKDFVEMSIQVADKLITKLKEKEKP